MSDVHQQRKQVETMDAVAWATGAFAALNLTWQTAKAKPGHSRVLGNTADKAALMDLTIKGGKIAAASAVVPVKPEYTPMLVLLLASLVEPVTMTAADQFLARQLNRLRRDKPSTVTAPWYRWRVTLTTTVVGLLTMKVR